MSRMEFLFHGQPAQVEDLTITLAREKEYLEHLIIINAGERTLTRQERVVRRLRDLVNRTPSEELQRFVRPILNS